MKQLLVIIIMLSSNYLLADDLKERKEHIREMEAKVSKLVKDRKIRSEKILSKFKVPINEYLPFIEEESEALVRTKMEIATRA